MISKYGVKVENILPLKERATFRDVGGENL